MTTSTQRISAGYKQTEIGVIPEDWDVKKLGEIGSFSKGQGIRKDQSQSGELPCVRYGELYTRHSNYIKQYYSFISKEVAATAKKLTVGDILFAGSGETKEEIGKCAAFIDNIDAYTGGDVIIFSPHNTDSLFLGYLLNSQIVVKQKASKGQGDAIVHISASNLKEIQIPIPPKLEEQTAIATVLSDMDTLIEKMGKLIEKKKNIKQGAMQQLLTGKKHLPGFSGKWEVDKIKNISSITTGVRNTQDKIDDGEYPFFVRSSIVERINSYSFDGEAVLTAGDGVGTGKIFHYINGKFDFHQRVYKISDFSEKINGYFFYLFFSNYFLKRIMSMTAKSSVDSVRMEMIAEMPIPLPSLPEQQAIAQILSDMDVEIEKLESQLTKYKNIKQGMMQTLLTGKIRLLSK